MISNVKRTEHAEAALNGYVQLQGSAAERQFAIIDLITDLFHLAEDEGLERTRSRERRNCIIGQRRSNCT